MNFQTEITPDRTNYSEWNFYQSDDGEVYRAESLAHAIQKRVNNFIANFDRYLRGCWLLDTDFSAGTARVRIEDSRGRLEHIRELSASYHGPADMFRDPWTPDTHSDELARMRAAMTAAVGFGNPNVRVVTRERNPRAGIPVFTDRLASRWPSCHLSNDLNIARFQMQAAGLEY